MSLHIIQSGFLSLLQDYGRYGYHHSGLTHGGPLDEHAFLWANRLLANHYNASQIEISYGVFKAEFLEDSVIALCGADLNASINGKPIMPWQTYNINRGDIIEFGCPKQGLRAYLAIKGGFNVAKTLSSVATVLRENIGGLNGDGGKLTVGDCIAYEKQPHQTTICVPEIFIPAYLSSITLRFVPNVSLASAGCDVQRDFQRHTYEVTQNIDRMGYRLSGKEINAPLNGIVSQGVSMGSIQLPKDGQPIVLMKDRQTMGGYPLLGCVSTLDLPMLAQSAPGVKVNFKAVDVDDLEAELLQHKQFFNTRV